MARTNTLNSKSNRGKTALTVLFAAVALFYLMPIIPCSDKLLQG